MAGALAVAAGLVSATGVVVSATGVGAVGGSSSFSSSQSSNGHISSSLTPGEPNGGSFASRWSTAFWSALGALVGWVGSQPKERSGERTRRSESWSSRSTSASSK